MGVNVIDLLHDPPSFWHQFNLKRGGLREVNLWVGVVGRVKARITPGVTTVHWMFATSVVNADGTVGFPPSDVIGKHTSCG